MGRYVEVAPGAMAYRGAWKSHMQRRDGETVAQYQRRLSCSCYRCGYYEPNEAVLDAHKDTCTGIPLPVAGPTAERPT